MSGLELSFLDPSKTMSKDDYDANDNQIVDIAESLVGAVDATDNTFYGKKEGVLGFHVVESGTTINSIGDINDVSISGITTGQVLQWNGSSFVPATVTAGGGGANSLNDLMDATISGTPVVNQALVFDGVSFTNRLIAYSDISGTPNLSTVATSGDYEDLTNKPTIPTTIGQLSDVSIASISNGQVLQWNGSSFVPATVTAGGGANSLNELSDVTISSPSTNQVLRYNGSTFVNSQLEYSALSGTPNLSNVATSGDYEDLTNKPTIPVMPTLSAVATSGSYNDLSGVPSFSQVALSGQYSDLLGRPTIPAVLGDLNDVATSPASVGQVLQWNGTMYAPATVTAGGGGASTMNDLSDVDTTGVSDGDVLSYDGATSSWKPVSGGLGSGGGGLKVEYVRIIFALDNTIPLTGGVETTDGVGVEIIDHDQCRWRIFSKTYRYPPMAIHAYSFNGTGTQWDAVNGFRGGEYRTRIFTPAVSSGNIINRDQAVPHAYTRGEPFGNFNMPSTVDPDFNRYSINMYTLPPDWQANQVTAFTGDERKAADLWFMLVFGE